MKLSYGENLLRTYLKKCFPKEERIYNHRELGIINHETGKALELDIYYPALKIAFEFQGTQHRFEEQKKKDKIKKDFCKKNGIILFCIWTNTLTGNIYELIVEKCPHLKVVKPKKVFLSKFNEWAEEYKKNIYKMNKKIDNAWRRF